MDKKKTIYYARTYRRLKLNLKKNILFSCLLIIPTLALLVRYVDDITAAIMVWGEKVLSKVIPAEQVSIEQTEYSIFNVVSYLKAPTSYPSTTMILINLAVCAIIYIVTRCMKVTGQPIAIYSLFAVFIHSVSCIFFLFASKYFPYETVDYSYLYMLQQIGIWWTFTILAGLVVAFLGDKGYMIKIVTFVSIMLYSFVFGVVRYILYIFVLYKFSMLYMALLFFVIGPAFDFSYFVAIYARFVNKEIKEYDHGKMKGEWEWS